MDETVRPAWHAKAIEATRGNQSQMGALVIAILGKRPKYGPWFGKSATITTDGYLICDFMDRHQAFHMGAFVGSVRDLIVNLRGLADHLQLNDEDRKAMFLAARQWIATDCRPEGARTWA